MISGTAQDIFDKPRCWSPYAGIKLAEPGKSFNADHCICKDNKSLFYFGFWWYVCRATGIAWRNENTKVLYLRPSTGEEW